MVDYWRKTNGRSMDWNDQATGCTIVIKGGLASEGWGDPWRELSRLTEENNRLRSFALWRIQQTEAVHNVVTDFLANKLGRNPKPDSWSKAPGLEAPIRDATRELDVSKTTLITRALVYYLVINGFIKE